MGGDGDVVDWVPRCNTREAVHHHSAAVLACDGGGGDGGDRTMF